MMTSRQSSAPPGAAVNAAAVAISPPGAASLLKQQQQASTTSPRVGFMAPPDSLPSVAMPNGTSGSGNNTSNVAPGVANPLGNMALPLALLAHQQQPVYIYPPPSIQSFPCYFPGTPLPLTPGPAPTAPFSPAATAAIMAAMGVPPQNNQSLPGSPFITPQSIGTPLTSVFRFNPPQPQQAPPPLSAAQPLQQAMPINSSKASIGVGDAILSPPVRLLQPSFPATIANGNNASAAIGNSATPVIISSASSSTTLPNFATSSQASPKQAPVHTSGSLSSPSGVNSSSSGPPPQLHAARPVLSFENNAQAVNSSSARTRKRPPNLTIPISNFDVEPASNSAMVGDKSGWSLPGGAPVPKTPKTAPNMSISGIANTWPNRMTPRLPGLPTASSAGPRTRGRPPLHHKPPISADRILSHDINGFPSSSSSAYNSPHPAPHANSTSHSTSSDFSHHQQEVVINSPSHLLYPDHFKRGSLIRLADGSFKCVEDMSTGDFTRSAQLSGELQLDSSQVLQIEPNPMRGAAMLHLAVGDQSPINIIKIHVEAPLEHPFFVYNVGWSSCDPERTRLRYGLTVNQLRIGDKCISLTRKPPLAAASLVSVSVSPASLLPPPAPLRRGGASGNAPPNLPMQMQHQAASSAMYVDIKDEAHPQVASSSGNAGKESAEEMESIATASLLSLQQSKVEAVSSTQPFHSTVTKTSSPSEASKEEASSQERQASLSPSTTHSSCLVIVDTSDSSVTKDGSKVVTASPRDDFSSAASEPVANESTIVSSRPTTSAFTAMPKRAATRQPLAKPRLLLYPGQHLSKTGKPGSPTFLGLRRRRHRSTSALAVAELSPKSKVFFKPKEVFSTTSNVQSPTVISNDKATSANGSTSVIKAGANGSSRGATHERQKTVLPSGVDETKQVHNSESNSIDVVDDTDSDRLVVAPTSSTTSPPML